MYSVNFLEKENLVYVQINGAVGHVDIINFLDSIRINDNIPKKSKLLTDFREAILENKDVGGIKAIVDYFKSTFYGRFDFLQWANVANSPLFNVGVILFVDSAKPENSDYKVFTTLEAALFWLGVPEQKNELIP